MEAVRSAHARVHLLDSSLRYFSLHSLDRRTVLGGGREVVDSIYFKIRFTTFQSYAQSQEESVVDAGFKVLTAASFVEMSAERLADYTGMAL
jgi:hypothetical protein